MAVIGLAIKIFVRILVFAFIFFFGYGIARDRGGYADCGYILGMIFALIIAVVHMFL